MIGIGRDAPNERARRSGALPEACLLLLGGFLSALLLALLPGRLRGLLLAGIPVRLRAVLAGLLAALALLLLRIVVLAGHLELSFQYELS
jgi:hypothetical protein